MPRLLTLSRAARLVGVRRGALQSKIRSGELAAFEGMVSAEDLLRAYPQARLEDNSGLERFEAIKDAAFARRMRERLMPSTEALVARLAEMSREPERYPYQDWVCRLEEVGGYLVRELANHIYKEDNILYQMALQTIEPEDWAEMKPHCDRIGYCCFTPGLGGK